MIMLENPKFRLLVKVVAIVTVFTFAWEQVVFADGGNVLSRHLRIKQPAQSKATGDLSRDFGREPVAQEPVMSFTINEVALDNPAFVSALWHAYPELKPYVEQGIRFVKRPITIEVVFLPPQTKEVERLEFDKDSLTFRFFTPKRNREKIRRALHISLMLDIDRQARRNKQAIQQEQQARKTGIAGPSTQEKAALSAIPASQRGPYRPLGRLTHAMVLIGLSVSAMLGSIVGTVSAARQGQQPIQNRAATASTASYVPTDFAKQLRSVSSKTPLSTFVWDPQNITDYDYFCNMAVSTGIKTLWVHGLEFLDIMSASQRQSFMQAAHSRGIKIMLGGGAPEWSMGYAVQYYSRLKALRPDGYWIDMEITGDQTHYMGIRDRISREVGVGKLTAFERFWVNQQPGYRLFRNGATAIMSYRDTATGPDSILGISGAMRTGARQYMLGIETMPLPGEPQKVTLNEEKETIPDVLDIVATTVSTDPRCKGIFIHVASSADFAELLGTILPAPSVVAPAPSRVPVELASAPSVPARAGRPVDLSRLNLREIGAQLTESLPVSHPAQLYVDENGDTTYDCRENTLTIPPLRAVNRDADGKVIIGQDGKPTYSLILHDPRYITQTGAVNASITQVSLDLEYMKSGIANRIRAGRQTKLKGPMLAPDHVTGFGRETISIVWNQINRDNIPEVVRCLKAKGSTGIIYEVNHLLSRREDIVTTYLFMRVAVESGLNVTLLYDDPEVASRPDLGLRSMDMLVWTNILRSFNGKVRLAIDIEPNQIDDWDKMSPDEKSKIVQNVQQFAKNLRAQTGAEVMIFVSYHHTDNGLDLREYKDKDDKKGKDIEGIIPAYMVYDTTADGITSKLSSVKIQGRPYYVCINVSPNGRERSDPTFFYNQQAMRPVVNEVSRGLASDPNFRGIVYNWGGNSTADIELYAQKGGPGLLNKLGLDLSQKWSSTIRFLQAASDYLSQTEFKTRAEVNSDINRIEQSVRGGTKYYCGSTFGWSVYQSAIETLGKSIDKGFIWVKKDIFPAIAEFGLPWRLVNHIMGRFVCGKAEITGIAIQRVDQVRDTATGQLKTVYVNIDRYGRPNGNKPLDIFDRDFQIQVPNDGHGYRYILTVKAGKGWGQFRGFKGYIRLLRNPMLPGTPWSVVEYDGKRIGNRKLSDIRGFFNFRGLDRGATEQVTFEVSPNEASSRFRLFEGESNLRFQLINKSEEIIDYVGPDFDTTAMAARLNPVLHEQREQKSKTKGPELFKDTEVREIISKGRKVLLDTTSRQEQNSTRTTGYNYGITQVGLSSQPKAVDFEYSPGNVERMVSLVESGEFAASDIGTIFVRLNPDRLVLRYRQLIRGIPSEALNSANLPELLKEIIFSPEAMQISRLCRAAEAHNVKVVYVVPDLSPALHNMLKNTITISRSYTDRHSGALTTDEAVLRLYYRSVQSVVEDGRFDIKGYALDLRSLAVRNTSLFNQKLSAIKKTFGLKFDIIEPVEDFSDKPGHYQRVGLTQAGNSLMPVLDGLREGGGAVMGCLGDVDGLSDYLGSMQPAETEDILSLMRHIESNQIKSIYETPFDDMSNRDRLLYCSLIPKAKVPTLVIGQNIPDLRMPIEQQMVDIDRMVSAGATRDYARRSLFLNRPMKMEAFTASEGEDLVLPVLINNYGSRHIVRDNIYLRVANTEDVTQEMTILPARIVEVIREDGDITSGVSKTFMVYFRIKNLKPGVWRYGLSIETVERPSDKRKERAIVYIGKDLDEQTNDFKERTFVKPQETVPVELSNASIKVKVGENRYGRLAVFGEGLDVDGFMLDTLHTDSKADLKVGDATLTLHRLASGNVRLSTQDDEVFIHTINDRLNGAIVVTPAKAQKGTTIIVDQRPQENMSVIKAGYRKVEEYKEKQIYLRWLVVLIFIGGAGILGWPFLKASSASRTNSLRNQEMQEQQDLREQNTTNANAAGARSFNVRELCSVIWEGMGQRFTTVPMRFVNRFRAWWPGNALRDDLHVLIPGEQVRQRTATVTRSPVIRQAGAPPLGQLEMTMAAIHRDGIDVIPQQDGSWIVDIDPSNGQAETYVEEQAVQANKRNPKFYLDYMAELYGDVRGRMEWLRNHPEVQTIIPAILLDVRPWSIARDKIPSMLSYTVRPTNDSRTDYALDERFGDVRTIGPNGRPAATDTRTLLEAPRRPNNRLPWFRLNYLYSARSLANMLYYNIIIAWRVDEFNRRPLSNNPRDLRNALGQNRPNLLLAARVWSSWLFVKGPVSLAIYGLLTLHLVNLNLRLLGGIPVALIMTVCNPIFYPDTPIRTSFLRLGLNGVWAESWALTKLLALPMELFLQSLRYFGSMCVRKLLTIFSLDANVRHTLPFGAGIFAAIILLPLVFIFNLISLPVALAIIGIIMLMVHIAPGFFMDVPAINGLRTMQGLFDLMFLFQEPRGDLFVVSDPELDVASWLSQLSRWMIGHINVTKQMHTGSRLVFNKELGRATFQTTHRDVRDLIEELLASNDPIERAMAFYIIYPERLDPNFGLYGGGYVSGVIPLGTAEDARNMFGGNGSALLSEAETMFGPMFASTDGVAGLYLGMEGPNVGDKVIHSQCMIIRRILAYNGIGQGIIREVITHISSGGAIANVPNILQSRGVVVTPQIADSMAVLNNIGAFRVGLFVLPSRLDFQRVNYNGRLALRIIQRPGPFYSMLTYSGTATKYLHLSRTIMWASGTEAVEYVYDPVRRIVVPRDSLFGTNSLQTRYGFQEPEFAARQTELNSRQRGINAQNILEDMNQGNNAIAVINDSVSGNATGNVSVQSRSARNSRNNTNGDIEVDLGPQAGLGFDPYKLNWYERLYHRTIINFLTRFLGLMQVSYFAFMQPTFTAAVKAVMDPSALSREVEREIISNELSRCRVRSNRSNITQEANNIFNNATTALANNQAAINAALPAIGPWNNADTLMSAMVRYEEMQLRQGRNGVALTGRARISERGFAIISAKERMRILANNPALQPQDQLALVRLADIYGHRDIPCDAADPTLLNPQTGRPYGERAIYTAGLYEFLMGEYMVLNSVFAERLSHGSHDTGVATRSDVDMPLSVPGTADMTTLLQRYRLDFVRTRTWASGSAFAAVFGPYQVTTRDENNGLSGMEMYLSAVYPDGSAVANRISAYACYREHSPLQYATDELAEVLCDVSVPIAQRCIGFGETAQRMLANNDQNGLNALMNRFNVYIQRARDAFGKNARVMPDITIPETIADFANLNIQNGELQISRYKTEAPAVKGFVNGILSGLVVGFFLGPIGGIIVGVAVFTMTYISNFINPTTSNFGIGVIVFGCVIAAGLIAALGFLPAFLIALTVSLVIAQHMKIWAAIASRILPARWWYSEDILILCRAFGVDPHQFAGYWDSSSWRLALGLPMFEGQKFTRPELYTRRGTSYNAGAIPFNVALILLAEPPQTAPLSSLNLLQRISINILEAMSYAEDTLVGIFNFIGVSSSPVRGVFGWFRRLVQVDVSGQPDAPAAALQAGTNIDFEREERRHMESPLRAFDVSKGLGMRYALEQMWSHPFLDVSQQSQLPGETDQQFQRYTYLINQTRQLLWQLCDMRAFKRMVNIGTAANPDYRWIDTNETSLAQTHGAGFILGSLISTNTLSDLTEHTPISVQGLSILQPGATRSIKLIYFFEQADIQLHGELLNVILEQQRGDTLPHGNGNVEFRGFINQDGRNSQDSRIGLVGFDFRWAISLAKARLTSPRPQARSGRNFESSIQHIRNISTNRRGGNSNAAGNTQTVGSRENVSLTVAFAIGRFSITNPAVEALFDPSDTLTPAQKQALVDELNGLSSLVTPGVLQSYQSETRQKSASVAPTVSDTVPKPFDLRTAALATPEELSKAVIIINAGGPGNRLELSLPVAITEKLDDMGLRSKPTFPTGPVTQKTALVNALESINQIRMRTGVNIPTIVVVSDESIRQVNHAINESRNTTLQGQNIEVLSGTMYPAFKKNGFLYIARGKDGIPHIRTAPGGTYEGLKILFQQKGSASQNWHQYFQGQGKSIYVVLYGDDPILNDYDFISRVIHTMSANNTDILGVSIPKRTPTDPVGGTFANSKEDEKVVIIEKDDRKTTGLEQIEKAYNDATGKTFPFNTGTLVFSDTAVTLAQQTPLPPHVADRNFPDTKDPYSKAEEFLTDLVDKVGHKSGISMALADIDPSDYGATKNWTMVLEALHEMQLRAREVCKKLNITVEDGAIVEVGRQFNPSAHHNVGEGVVIESGAEVCLSDFVDSTGALNIPAGKHFMQTDTAKAQIQSLIATIDMNHQAGNFNAVLEAFNQAVRTNPIARLFDIQYQDPEQRIGPTIIIRLPKSAKEQLYASLREALVPDITELNQLLTSQETFNDAKAGAILGKVSKRLATLGDVVELKKPKADATPLEKYQTAQANYQTLLATRVLQSLTETATAGANGNLVQTQDVNGKSTATASSANGITIGSFVDIADGVRIQDVEISQENRWAKGRALVFNPKKPEVSLYHNPEALDWDLMTSDINAPEPGGKSLQKIVEIERAALAKKGQTLIAASNSLQSNFKGAPQFLIVEGELIRKHDGVRSIAESVYHPLSGMYAVLVLDKNRPSIRRVSVANNTLLDIDIENAIAGPELVVDGQDVSDRIRLSTDERGPNPTGCTNDLLDWDPRQVRASFSAIGIKEDGSIVMLSIAGDPGLYPNITEITISDLAEAMLGLDVKDAILLGGSGDVQQWVKDMDLIEARPGVHSTTKHMYPRPLHAAILVSTTKNKPIAQTEILNPQEQDEAMDLIAADAVGSDFAQLKQARQTAEAHVNGYERIKEELITRLAPEIEKDGCVLILCPQNFNKAALEASLMMLGFSQDQIKIASRPEEIKFCLENYNIIVIVNRLGNLVTTEELARSLPNCEFEGDAVSTVPATAKLLNTWL